MATAQLTRRQGGKSARVNGVTMWLLRSPMRALLDRHLCILRLTGRRTGTPITLPVQYARTGDGLVVLAGRGSTKNWWRNLRDPRLIEVWLDGAWRTGTGRLVLPGDADRATELANYRGSVTQVPEDSSDPLIHITLHQTPPERRMRRRRPGRPREVSSRGSPGLLSPRQLWGRWFGLVTLGETVGFLAPALAGGLTAGLGAAVSVPSLLAAGAVEGAILGAAQAYVLRRALPGLPSRRWIAATSLGAVASWFVGLVPSTVGVTLTNTSPAAIGALAVVLGAALLLPIGVAQWTVLRPHVAYASRWIITNATGWLAGLAAFLILATPLWQEGQPVALTIAIGVLAGLIMAATFAAVTGFGVLRLLFLVPPGFSRRR